MSNKNYNLNSLTAEQPKTATWSALRRLINLLPQERGNLVLALFAMLAYAFLTMLGPYIIGTTINDFIFHKDYHGVLVNCGWLLLIYMVNLGSIYLRTILMGNFGQRLLFTLRNTIFNKLQELPVAFFSQNKAGDLISRVNNDTDKLNQFFSQSLMQFVSSFFIIIGAGVFLLALNFRLGLATLAPAFLMWLFTKFLSPWVKRKNAINLKNVGGMSAEIQESLNNFKVILAFNRRDYFRARFKEANHRNYSSALRAGIANGIFTPVYGFLASMGQLIVLFYGIYLITAGSFTAGFLISFFIYATSFYDPLKQMAALWANFQVALAGWDRISHILSMESDLVTLSAAARAPAVTPSTNGNGNSSPALLEFRQVSFRYPDGKDVLHHNNFRMEKGKTYALVGPTGGGKTTTASLIARLYDPTDGAVLLDGKDIRTYTTEERTRKIGFILQEPFLFTGTVRDNILYGNGQYLDFSNEQLEQVIHDANLETLLSRFDQGLETPILSAGDGISLGQKQLIAFIRAVLRNPELLILDEATANIDTVTEKMLEDILRKLPDTTTRVIIAHRLNTIENADEIFFVNSGEIIRAGSLDQAVDMLLQGKRVS
ncbi:ABC transporter ATP-binding protein [Puia sp.]|jgi:ATP-binding cassette subfamily B protein|uniref:ABC transporter ATP-binding protein n=1 Tax=Puia sp. TaxID=2045100 RepID=UPI002F42A8D1